jgi:flagellar hook-associated protein 3 FlgL
MQIRVTLQTKAAQARNAVQARQRELMRAQEEVASGRRLLRPSDDPVAARKALLNRAQIAQIDQFLSNIELGKADLNAADALLADTGSRIVRAKEIAIAMGSDAQGAGARRTAALEVDALLDDVVALANSSFRGRHIFAGDKTLTQPVVRAGNDILYLGTDTGLRRRISQDAPLVETTLPGSKVFFTQRDGTTNAVQDGVFRNLAALKTALENNDGNAIRNTIAALEQDFQRATAARTTLGARAERLERTSERLQDLQHEIRSLQSTVEDVDLADAISLLQQRQIALQATLGASGQILPLSLLDFLIR